MPTHITQTENPEGIETTLRITGEMMVADALLLEKIVGGLRTGSEIKVMIDIANLDFLDSESGTILRQLVDKPGLHIEGIARFLQSKINDVEKRPPA